MTNEHPKLFIFLAFANEPLGARGHLRQPQDAVARCGDQSLGGKIMHQSSEEKTL